MLVECFRLGLFPPGKNQFSPTERPHSPRVAGAFFLGPRHSPVNILAVVGDNGDDASPSALHPLAGIPGRPRRESPDRHHAGPAVLPPAIARAVRS